MAHRSTRSKSRDIENIQKVDSPETLPSFLTWHQRCEATSVQMEVLRSPFTSKSTGLSKKNASLLTLKRDKLRRRGTQVDDFIERKTREQHQATSNLVNSAQATLVFGQEEAGTAICVSPCGLLLTCSHCVDDDERGARSGKPKWLIFASGEVVKAKCVAWDGRRDLALLQIVAAEASIQEIVDLTQEEDPEAVTTSMSRDFPYATIAPSGLKLPLKRSLVCIGHPGSEDLENDIAGMQTGYDVLHVSDGRYRGLAADQDPEDNSEIGALKHDCWTYWGHSGAGLIDSTTGHLIGLHSSWDDQTAMRRGVSLRAIHAFLEEYKRRV